MHLRPEHDPSCQAGGLSMVLTPKAQGLQLSTDGLRARLSQPPHGEDVALFLHTSGKHLLPHPAPGTESDHVALLALCRHTKILQDDSDERLYCPCMPVLLQRILSNIRPQMVCYKSVQAVTSNVGHMCRHHIEAERCTVDACQPGSQPAQHHGNI